MVARVIRLAEPHQRQRHGARPSTMSAQNRSVIALSPAAPFLQRALADPQRPVARPIAAGRVIDEPVSVRVLEIGGAGETFEHTSASSPCQRSRSANTGTRSLRPVARRIRSRKSGAPTLRLQTSPSPSPHVERHRVPVSPCRAGRRGRTIGPNSPASSTERRSCAARNSRRASPAHKGTAYPRDRSARELSQMTMTTRAFPAMSPRRFRCRLGGHNRRYRNSAAATFRPPPVFVV